MGLWKIIEANWVVFMTAKLAFAGLLLAGLAGGFAIASHLDRSEIELLKDCRDYGATQKPCPVIHDGKIQWRTNTVTKTISDPTQAQRIKELEGELALEKKRHARSAPTAKIQNGTREHPYDTAKDCPPGYMIFEDAVGEGHAIGVSAPANAKICFIRPQMKADIPYELH